MNTSNFHGESTQGVAETLRDVDLSAASSSDDEDSGSSSSWVSETDSQDLDISTLSADPDTAIMTEREYNRNKFERCRQHYNDAYVDLFNDSLNPQILKSDHANIGSDSASAEFVDSQIGCVTWTASEKAAFFDALSRYGRHDLPQLSLAVATKSQIEVKAYIELLQEAFADRQLFHRETKNASQSDFPAAIEVGPELEDRLNESAVALSLEQERYDLAAGQARTGGMWIVTRDLARILDDEAEKQYSDQDGERAEDAVRDRSKYSNRSSQLLVLTNWLDMSEKFFMNWPADATFEHWRVLAEPYQRPSLTMDAIMDFHHLAISLTQRILQVAIFLAKSRIRASTNTIRRPAKILSQGDVHAALDVLGMKHDSWDFWARLPRRNQLAVFNETHRKGSKATSFLTPLAAEKALLEMSATRLSKSRSRSRGRSASVDSAAMTDVDDAEELEDDMAETASRPSEEDHQTSSDEDDNLDESNLGATKNPANQQSTRNMSHQKRKLLLEESQDDYMERLDRKARLQHEQNLSRLYGDIVPATVKEEDTDLGPRPRTLRKTEEELRDWTSQHDTP